MSPETPLHILLVEDNPADAWLFVDSLRQATPAMDFVVTEVRRVGEIGEALREAGRAVDVAIVDLSLPDSSGLATVDRVREAVGAEAGRRLPVVVVTGLEDHAAALEAVRHGVQDYLVKGELYRGAAARAVRYAIERQRAEELHVAKESAEAANRAKDAFLAVISHDLRGPLTAILIWGKLVRQGKVKGEHLAETADMIVRCAEEQSRLIEDLLTMARLKEGNLRLNLTPTDLSQVVRETEQVARAVAEAEGVRLEAEGLECPLKVMADADRLRQVVNNLVFNAIKFTPRGGRVKVKLEAKDDGDSGARLQVIDEGCGIEPKLLERVFEKSWQADTPAPKNQHRHSLGLGLSIARSIVDLHGGKIKAASEGIGRGATFTVELPGNGA